MPPAASCCGSDNMLPRLFGTATRSSMHAVCTRPLPSELEACQV